MAVILPYPDQLFVDGNSVTSIRQPALDDTSANISQIFTSSAPTRAAGEENDQDDRLHFRTSPNERCVKIKFCSWTMEVVQLDKSKGLSAAITLRWAVQNKSCEQSVAFRASVRLPHFIHGVDIASSRFMTQQRHWLCTAAIVLIPV